MFGYKLPSFIKKIDIKNMSVVLTFIYVISVIPMLAIGLYNWPSVDDFSMALQPHQTFVATGNFFVTVWSAFTKTIFIYYNWVGYYFSSFLTCLSPSIFGERWSALNAIIVLGMLTYGVMYFFNALLTRVWKMNGHMVYSLSMVTLIMIVQCMENGPTRAEAFYWWSGAINYTFMFGLALVWIGMIFRFVYEAGSDVKGFNAKWAWKLIKLCLVGFLLGGSNYMTALVMAVCSVLGLFIVVMIKLGKFELQGDGSVRGLWIAFVCNLVGLMISAAAPGNQIRGTKMGDMNPIKVVLRAYYSVFDICVNDMMRWEVLLLLVLVAIVAWKMAGSMAYDLKHPVVFAVFSLSMMACCVAPPLYAVGDISAARIRSTMWMQFIVMLVLTVVYYVRWIWQMLDKGEGFKSDGKAGQEEQSRESRDKYSILSSTIVTVLVLFLAFGSLLCIYANPHYYSVTSAISDMASGQATTYLSEKMERLEILQDESIRDAVFQPHTAKPELLFQSDIYTDASIWENEIVATYYGKDSVRVTQ